MDRDSYKNAVIQATDIVQLIGSHLTLHAKGREYVGLCPFHNDTKPSMTVAPGKQLFKCFACGAGGDSIKFVMEYHKMSFLEALDFLGERAGIEKPKEFQRGGNDPHASMRKRLQNANEQAMNFFRDCLSHPRLGKEAREYLERRGVTQQMISEFQLGYAPDGWDHLLKHVHSKGLDLQAFEQAGLIQQRNNGSGHYDKLRHRLVFPICDGIGRVIAFGGRKMREEDEPKYLNSPETPLFNKSATLYGLNLAKKPVMDAPDRSVVITEGYTDVIACHQAGVRNVVATLGTALTRQHAQELKRYCDKVILLFDGDEAGMRAADRGLEIFFNEPIDVFIAIVPGGQDPDELLKQEGGTEAWAEVMKNATDAMTFHFQRTKKRLDQSDSIAGKSRIAEEYIQALAKLGIHRIDPMRKGYVIERIAEQLRISGDEARKMLDAQRELNKQNEARQKAFTRNRERQQQQRRPSGPTQAPSSSGNAPPRPQGQGQPAPQGYYPEEELSEYGDFGGEMEVLPGDDFGASGNTPVSSDHSESSNYDGNSSAAVPRGRKLAEEQIVGAILNRPELFLAEMLDGRPLCETIAPEDFQESLLKVLYSSIADWLWGGHEKMTTSDLRDVFNNEHLYSMAIDLKFRFDFEGHQAEVKALKLLQGAVRAIHEFNARQNRQQEKMSYQQPTEAQVPEENGNKEVDPEAEKLLRGLAFRRDHAAMGRLGRVEGE